MPADVEPPELARLIDFAERSRAHDWSLRSALTRYAQGQPQRASDVLALVRRIESVVPSHLASLRRDGPALWNEVRSGSARHTGDPVLVELLRGMIELDRLGDILAEWAADPTGPTGERPDAAVDAVTVDIAQRLEQLGVPHEERQRPVRQRG
ncbi:MAG: hypothetical protein M3349_09250 [Actinomycetota bacterium]|nr:hypothetical protein [Actinomycetota bacterium]